MTDARHRPPLNDAVHVVPADPAWVQAGREARRQVLEVISPVTPALVEHVGSTSVPGLASKPVLDLVASVMDFPLPEAALEGLAKLGYEYRGEAGVAGRQFFRSNPRTQHLHVFGLGHPAFAQHMRFRSYLRSHTDAARRYETLKVELASRFRHDRHAYTNGKHDLIKELLEAALTWEFGFGPLRELQRTLANAPFRWCVAGGWALDVFLGRVERAHEDTDLIIYRDDATTMHAFLAAQGWTLELIRDSRYQPWLPGTTLPDNVTQCRAEHPRTAVGYLDVLFTPGDALHWAYRRDPSITLARTQAELVGAHGIAALAPELVLLFKSGGAGKMGLRNKDSLDFERMLPALGPERRSWLRGVLEAKHPDHPWLERL